MVPKVGLEPTRLAPLPPQDSVSTNFTTSAGKSFFSHRDYDKLSGTPGGCRVPFPADSVFALAEAYFGTCGASGAAGPGCPPPGTAGGANGAETGTSCSVTLRGMAWRAYQ